MFATSRAKNEHAQDGVKLEFAWIWIHTHRSEIQQQKHTPANIDNNHHDDDDNNNSQPYFEIGCLRLIEEGMGTPNMV